MQSALILCPAWSREMPHLAIALLSSYLRKHGYQVSVFDLNNDFYHNASEAYKDTWKKEKDLLWTDPDFVARFISENNDLIDVFLGKIMGSGASVIGFSVYYPNELMSLELARRIKKIDKSRTIVFGGPQCLREHDGKRFLIDGDAVDIVVTGEGEATLLDLVGSIERGGKIDFCKGTLIRVNGDIVDGGDRPSINDLDSLPYADFTDFDLSRYEYKVALPILSSRGCIQNCVFCTVNSYWKRYRSFSGERLFKEVEHQLNLFKEVKDLHFYDPLLNGNIKHLEAFCDRVIERKKENSLFSISWQGESIVRPDMTGDLLKKMKDAGCYHMAYGIESGSQRVLDSMKKRFKIIDTERLIRETHEAGIKTALNFMFGFPTETEEDFKESLEFLKKNHRYIDSLIPSEAFCSIHEHTYLYNHLEEFGISTSNFHKDFWESMNGRNNYIERLRRFEEFCELAMSLNINIGTGYSKIKAFREKHIEGYRSYKGLNKTEDNHMTDTKESNEIKQNGRFSFSWDLHYKCNYRCPYCWFHGKWEDMEKLNRYEPIDKWIGLWERVYHQCGSAHIDILGGEPFLYPDFIELIVRLSRLHDIVITTNLSVHAEVFAREVDPLRVKVNATFHPLFADMEQFVKRALLLKEKGFSGSVVYLAYPSQIGKIPYYRQKFQEKGLPFSILTYWGQCRGISYPDGYTDEEKAIIHGSIASRGGEEFQTVPKKVKGRLCHAGHRYAVIQGDGNVLRCGGGLSNESIGNFFDDNFKLLDGPLPCNAEFCRCNEWALLLEDKN
ncbi:MAG: radical SAM protein [Candidatus Omnitrophica bacterium]|nr:radical SAM protein [Candidatus Omnitrophota bacterium]